jgi:hypothetical protein
LVTRVLHFREMAIDCPVTDAPLSFRRARPDDVRDIVRMLADDPLGSSSPLHLKT